MFCDITEIIVKAGKGGDGIKSARREKYIPFGGPDGGDGGKGGDLIIKTNENLNSLIELHTKKRFFAEEGEPGGSNDRHGKNGEDLVLEVPVGTIIENTLNGERFDLKTKNSAILIAVGGRGGYGNAHFTSSTRQFPEFAELGEPTYEIPLKMELKLVADVGIIGFPSVGKSSLINTISNVKAKVGAYDFTTLIPNIGICKFYENSFILSDIPGIIEGASEGKGLGIQFLKHISRNSILLHILDGNSLTVKEDYKKLNIELKNFSKDLAGKKQIVVVNKIDLLDEESIEILKEDLDLKNIFFISTVSRDGIQKLLEEIWSILKKKKAEEIVEDTNEEVIYYKPHLQKDEKICTTKELENYEKYEDLIGKIEEGKKVFLIEGKRIEQIAKMTNFDQKAGIERLYDVVKKMKVQNNLNKLKANPGDILIFGDHNKILTFREGFIF